MSGTREFLAMAAKLYPSNQPPSMEEFHTRDPVMEGISFASSNKFVQYLEAASEASSLYPPEPVPPRPFVPLPRRIPLNQPQQQQGSATARRLPPSTTSNSRSSSSTTATNTTSKLRAVQVLHGEKRLAKKYKSEWKDLPYSNDFSLGSNFLNLPFAMLDLILSDTALNLRDHVSLAATCRSIRACYYSPPFSAHSHSGGYSSLWRALVALRPPVEQGQLKMRKLADSKIEETINKIWTNGSKIDTDTFKVIHEDVAESSDDEDVQGGGGAVSQKKKKEKTNLAIRSKEWDNAIDLVHTIRISKTEARKVYKVAESELSNFLSSFEVKSKGGTSTKTLYLESAVESLALRLHGGVRGHKKHVAQAVETSRKRKLVRDHNAAIRQGASREGSADSE